MSAVVVDEGHKAEKPFAPSSSTTLDNEKHEDGAVDDTPDEAKPRPERTATFNDYLVSFSAPLLILCGIIGIYQHPTTESLQVCFEMGFPGLRSRCVRLHWSWHNATPDERCIR